MPNNSIFLIYATVNITIKTWSSVYLVRVRTVLVFRFFPKFILQLMLQHLELEQLIQNYLFPTNSCAIPL